MVQLLDKTAWPMNTPALFSPFHLAAACSGILLALLAAKKLKHCTEAVFYRILAGCGIVLGASELYKQCFLYYVVNEGRYDWWYFPFQLCSIPMYFCLLLPFIRSQKLKKIVLTFMQDFNLLGGAMALAYPEGFLHPYWVLTLHGFIWHSMLVFLGLFIGFSGRADNSTRGYLKTIPLFGICCLAASVINICTPVKGEADMFYISPYYPSSQIVFHEIAQNFGIMAGNITYLSAICLGGYLVHLAFSRFIKN
ncbi:MAG: YwaF family protein [Clostridiaceae bacterium]|nr:YwaF family protein [Clostridiaceae bacterium]